MAKPLLLQLSFTLKNVDPLQFKQIISQNRECSCNYHQFIHHTGNGRSRQVLCTVGYSAVCYVVNYAITRCTRSSWYLYTVHSTHTIFSRNNKNSMFEILQAKKVYCLLAIVQQFMKPSSNKQLSAANSRDHLEPIAKSAWEKIFLIAFNNSYWNDWISPLKICRPMVNVTVPLVYYCKCSRNI